MLTLEQILAQHKKNRLAPLNPNEVHQSELGVHDRIAVFVTRAIGTMWAVYAFALFMLSWMVWQWTMDKQAFDPYPFAFLLFLGNIIQLLLMPLIMVGQNVQSKHSEVRAEESYKAATASFKDSEHIMDHLAALDRELLLHREMLSKLLDKWELSADFLTSTGQGIHVSIEGHLREEE